MNLSTVLLDTLTLLWKAFLLLLKTGMKTGKWLYVFAKDIHSKHVEAKKQKQNEVPVEVKVNGTEKVEEIRNGNGNGNRKMDEVEVIKKKNQKACLQDAPLKIQIEVLKYLHWKDILRIRRVCKSWNKATKDKEIWTFLVELYTSFVSRPPSPEEPLEKYNQQELEYWLLKRLSVDLAWRADPSSSLDPSSSVYQAAFLKAYTNAFTQTAYTTTRYRPIKCDEDRPPIVFSLVEGGRWLLVPDIDGLGRVTVFDLDGSQIKKKQLVEPLDKVDVVRTSLMCIDVDRNEKVLTFNMLLTCVNRDPGGPPAHIRIYRVTLQGHGSNAYLHPRHATSFGIPGPGKFNSVDMKGDMFVRARKTLKSSYIEIFKWSQSTSTVHTRVRIPVEHEIEQLRFVETDRIVAFSKTHMFIFPIPTFQTIQVANDDINNHPIIDLISPLWKLPCDGSRLCRGGISPLYYDGPPPAPIQPTPRKQPIQRKNAPYIRSKVPIQPPEPPKQPINPGLTKFTISCKKGIYAISIPSLKELKPRLTQLLPYTSATTESGFSLGLSKAFFRHRDSSCTTLCYAWLDGEVVRNKGRNFRLRGGGLQVVRERGYPGRWDADPPVLDEGSGRVVMFTKEGLGVVDTALV